MPELDMNVLSMRRKSVVARLNCITKNGMLRRFVLHHFQALNLKSKTTEKIRF